MLPTPTPIVLSNPVASSGNPLIAVLIIAVAIGLQVLLFYRRRRLAQQIRAAKKRS